MHQPLPIAVLISGTGRSLRNLIERIDAGTLPAEIRLVVSSRTGVKGLDIAEAAGIATEVHQRKSHESDEAYGEAVFERVRASGAELVVMAGFLRLLPIPPEFENRVINIHPALIPAFCGHGYYGDRVHQAVLDYGAKVTGCTVHFVDNEYDRGPIILQRTAPVRDDDTAETLAARVFTEECQALPEAIALIAAGRVHVAGRRVRIDA